MVKHETWVIDRWEDVFNDNRQRLSWMKGQYQATDLEVKVEAIGKTVTAFTLQFELMAEESKASDLREIGRTLERVPARESLSQKHLSWSKREQYGKIE